MNLADEMAYNAHDIDDGVRSGLLRMPQLLQLPLFRRFHDEALAACPSLADAGERRLLSETIRRMRRPGRQPGGSARGALLDEHAPADAEAAPGAAAGGLSAHRCARPPAS